MDVKEAATPVGIVVLTHFGNLFVKARVEGRQFGFSLLHSEKISQPNAAFRLISRGIILGLRWSPSNDVSVEGEQISERSLYFNAYSYRVRTWV